MEILQTILAFIGGLAGLAQIGGYLFGHESLSGWLRKKFSGKPIGRIQKTAINVIAIVVLSGSVAFLVSQFGPPREPSVKGTPTPAGINSNRQEPTPTPTSIVTPTPTSVFIPTQSPVSEQALYEGIVNRPPDITDSSSGSSPFNWQENASCAFTNGSYNVTVSQQGQFQECFATNTSTILSNFAFQAQMTIISGDIGGLVFRATSPNATSIMYRTQIDNHGYYDIYLGVPQKCNHEPSNPHGHTYCLSQSAIQGDGNPNQLTVIAQGGTIYFYINGEYVDKANSDLSASGYIGVFAQYRKSPTDVVFSHVKIWKL